MRLYTVYVEERDVEPNQHGVYQGGGGHGRLYVRAETGSQARDKALRAVNEYGYQPVACSHGEGFTPAGTRYTVDIVSHPEPGYVD